MPKGCFYRNSATAEIQRFLWRIRVEDKRKSPLRGAFNIFKALYPVDDDSVNTGEAAIVQKGADFILGKAVSDAYKNARISLIAKPEAQKFIKKDCNVRDFLSAFFPAGIYDKEIHKVIEQGEGTLGITLEIDSKYGFLPQGLQAGYPFQDSVLWRRQG